MKELIFIVTPGYILSDKLQKTVETVFEQGNEPVIVLTDASSTVFPSDVRENWFDHSWAKQQLEYIYIDHNIEDEDNGISKAIREYLYLEHGVNEDSDYENVTIIIESPMPFQEESFKEFQSVLSLDTFEGVTDITLIPEDLLSKDWLDLFQEQYKDVLSGKIKLQGDAKPIDLIPIVKNTEGQEFALLLQNIVTGKIIPYGTFNHEGFAQSGMADGLGTYLHARKITDSRIIFPIGSDKEVLASVVFKADDFIPGGVIDRILKGEYVYLDDHFWVPSVIIDGKLKTSAKEYATVSEYFSLLDFEHKQRIKEMS